MLLKVGSWNSECIIILLIYFINCQKARFTKKQVSFSKKLKYKISRFARDSLILLRTPVSAIFVFAPKILSCCIAFMGTVYPFAMPGPPAELMTREKNNF